MALFDIFSSFKSPGAGGSRVVGIDIGSSSIKVVELENRGGTITLTTYGEVQLGPYDGKDLGRTVVLSAKQEQSALVDVLRESAVKARQSVFAMPLSSSFVTVMDLSVKKGEDIGPRIRVEARKYIPVPISDVTLDWAEIELPKAEKQGDLREVLLAAIQNDGLSRLRTLMQHVGMPNQPSEIECFSAIRGTAEADDGGMAVIDLGAVSSKLYVTKQSLLHRMHRVRVGGSQCTETIARTKSISFREAELLKRQVSTDDPEHGDVMAAHQECLGRALHEFKLVLDEFEARHDLEVDRVVLTGGLVHFPGLIELVEEKIKRQLTVANPFSKVAYPAFMEDVMTSISPSFTVAAGAALRAFE